VLIDKFGVGVQGRVVGNDAGNAVKAFEFEEHYKTEREAYRRIRKARLQKIGPFNNPQLKRCDDELWIIEMSVVQPPFLVDFAAAYIDRPHPYSYEELEAWHESQTEIYGHERWEIVTDALSKLYGATKIRYFDASPRNIRFTNEDPDD